MWPALALALGLSVGASPATTSTAFPQPSSAMPGPDPATLAVTFETVQRGFTMAVGVASPPDGSGRLFVLEKDGWIRVVRDGRLLPEPFLDLRGEVSTELERGLLGLAFHPRFRENGTFFVCYTALDGALVYARYDTGTDADRADPATRQVVLTFPHPQRYHNAGHLAFGPDGYLYIATGDGGDGQSSQDLRAWTGKMLRIDVDGAAPYTVPTDNPFLGEPGARTEVWALGLRNPWRFGFDRQTGDLYLADVGADRREEVDFQPAGMHGGANYGWPRMEGSLCVPGFDCAAYTPPILEYDHSQGCSITGGYVYRGRRYPALEGAYFYADWCQRTVWAASRDASGAWRSAQVGRTAVNPTSFGEDEAGELYVVGQGQLLRLIGPSDPGAPTSSPTDARATTVAPTGTTTPAVMETPVPSPQRLHLPLAWR